MGETHETWIERVGQWGWLSRAALLFVVFAVFLLIASPVANWRHGREGVWAALLAATVCLVSGWLAMLATAWLAPPNQPAAHVLIGMMIRMSIPLLACLWVTQQSEWLTEAGFAPLVVAAFSVGLAVETLFSVGQLQSVQPSPSSSASETAGSDTPGSDTPGSSGTSRESATKSDGSLSEKRSASDHGTAPRDRATLRTL